MDLEPKMDGFRAPAHVEGHRGTKICCLEPDGSTNFRKLLFRTEWPVFVAFDALAVDGEDIRCLSLRTRKLALRRIMPRIENS